mgnify:CR=1 FL=1|tara:strand:- start:774 stop:1097 length:324 start_codon:yes stop_codon:yes gene_type:complete
MEAMTQQVIVDLFTNTPFVGFLIWQYIQMRKDYKEQSDKMDVLRKESIEREEVLRDRFEKVIENLNSDKDQLVQGLEGRLKDVEIKISTLESQIKKLFSMVKELVRR